MNHETKEVILKVTDVVKTVVHFGFIPFVIYLGFTRTQHQQALLDPNVAAELTIDEIFDGVVLYGMGNQEESARYQQDGETFPWASDEPLTSEEEQEYEAHSEDNVGTTATNISTETASAIADLDAADIDMFKQLIEAIGLVGTDPIYSYHRYHNNDSVRREGSADESEVAFTTVTHPDSVHPKSAVFPSSEDDENVFSLFGSQGIVDPSASPPRPRPPLPRPPPPGLAFDFESRLSLPRRRQRSGFYNDSYRPATRRYVPPVIRENYTPAVRIQDTPDIIPEFMGIDIPTGKAGCARRDAVVRRPSALKKRVGKPIDTPLPANVEEAPTTRYLYPEPEALAASNASTKAEPEIAKLTETKQETPTEPSILIKEDTPTSTSPRTKQRGNDKIPLREGNVDEQRGIDQGAPDFTIDSHLGNPSQHICLDLQTTKNDRGAFATVIDLDYPCSYDQDKPDNGHGRTGGRVPRELRYYQPPPGLSDCADTILAGEEFSIPKTATDLGDSGDRVPIRILDDFVIYNKNKSRPGYGFRFSDLEKCFDRRCDIGVSGRVRPALIKHGRIFGRKKVQTTGTGTNDKPPTIHVSKVLGWGVQMVDNGESYLWVKTQFATYILGSPAPMYGPIYDDLFKKTRLTNLLMVALIADEDVTLDKFVSNMRYTKAGAYNRSPRRVLAGGPVRPNWDQPLTHSDLMTHSAFIQEEIVMWWKQYNLPWEEGLTPSIFKELNELTKAHAILGPVARFQVLPLRKKRVQEEMY
ncbi:hypothetical protein BG015_001292 [Linnemannia schmuckeri]|uniref:RFTS domain-containing protein n=1 Tax=Linnemannia schmuckeri TaxID=64567 RepID=A0A9P5S646_9FUNG|nr:hypothetical protein BG015_001292 [Linnemannia schmuckeri]